MTLISKFFAPIDEVEDVGLKEILMPRLGRYVALAGKNGSGKSRILNKLEWYVSARINAYDGIAERRERIAQHEAAIANNPGSPSIEAWRNTITSDNQQLTLRFERVVSNETAGRFKAIRFVPKQLNLADPRKSPSSHLDTGFAQAKVLGLTNFEQSCLFYVKKLQERWWNVSHQGFSGPNEVKQAVIADYEGFKAIVYRLLREQLDRDVDGEPTLFGNQISDANLSDGQKIILQLCVGLHAQKGDFDNTVFILDEPENHLHPSAVIDLLESLYQATERSQIWIATHSIPLLAYVASIEPMALWFIENGLVKNSGRAPQEVLKGLLGSDDRIGQLNAFTGLPAQLASIQYACESLLPPQVVSDGERDPQVSQIQKIITSFGDAAPVRVLDFGAGKGRLLGGLAEGFMAAKQNLPELIDYFAFDQFPEDQDICQSVIHTHIPGEIKRYFGSTEEFFSSKDDHSIDIAVMCNVLHEIAPRDWVKLFAAQSLIRRSLSDSGFLLIVEDQRIPVGEKAHEHGFIVLDTPHLRTLFGIKDSDVQAGNFVANDCRNDGRLKAHLIAKTLLNRLTSQTRKEAVEQLRATAKERIAQLRTTMATYANGQLHGFWTQQFANASLFLEET